MQMVVQSTQVMQVGEVGHEKEHLSFTWTQRMYMSEEALSE
jgi:hypothetical protein